MSYVLSCRRLFTFGVRTYEARENVHIAIESRDWSCFNVWLIEKVALSPKRLSVDVQSNVKAFDIQVKMEIK